DHVTAPSSGTYALTVYAAVSGTRSLFLSVDGAAGIEIPFTGTSFNSPVPVTVQVPLDAGANSLRFYNDAAYGPDLDRVVVGGGGTTAGWTIAPPGPVAAPATWTVTPPKDATPGTYTFTVDGTLGGATFAQTVTVVVPGSRLESGYLSDQQWLESQNYWGP